MNASSENDRNVGLSGLRVCAFESRMQSEMHALVERQGGIATIAPSMREVPIEENPAAVAVQEYGEPNPELYEALAQRHAEVVRVPVYRWALPEDTGPLLSAIRTTIAGQFDVLIFTSAQQLRNVLTVAESAGLRDAWIE